MLVVQATNAGVRRPGYKAIELQQFTWCYGEILVILEYVHQLFYATVTVRTVQIKWNTESFCIFWFLKFKEELTET